MFSGYPGAGQGPQGTGGGPQAFPYGQNGPPSQSAAGGVPYPAGATTSGPVASTQGAGGYPSMIQGQQGYSGAPTGYQQPQGGGYPPMGPNGAASGAYPPLQPGNPFAPTGPWESSSGAYPPLAGSNSAPDYMKPSAAAPIPAAASYPPASGAAPSGPAFPNLTASGNQHATYGHLEHAPSFNTASQACRISQTDTMAAAAAGGDPQACWTLAKDLPQAPRQDIIGPFLRFNDYDPMSGTFATSVLVVTHPRISGSTIQASGTRVLGLSTHRLIRVTSWLCLWSSRWQ
jgi:hypothetical protein